MLKQREKNEKVETMNKLGDDKLILFGAAQTRVFQWIIRNYVENIKFIIDNDEAKWGTHINGIEIKPVDSLVEEKGEYQIIITTHSYWQEMKEQLRDMNMEAIIAEKEIPFFSSKDFLIQYAKEDYHITHCSYEQFLPKDKVYTYDSDYMNWGEYAEWLEDLDYVVRDSKGVVMIKCNNQEVYNPVTICEWVLILWGQYLNGIKSKKEFLDAAELLTEFQNEDGSFRYNYDYPYYLNEENYFKSGWVSGMAQGHALSVYARAYSITGDNKWVVLAKKVLEFMCIDVNEGGVKSNLQYLKQELSEYITIEEWPAIPSSYTLNGFMYAIIGLYDWSCTKTESGKKARSMYEKCIITLKLILPLYDVNGMSSYDLGHIIYKTELPNISAHYHSVHVAFCYIFYYLTNDSIFREYYERWRNAVKQ